MSERTNDWTEGGAIGRSESDALADTPGREDPAEIRADIRETRERLGDTLEEIGARLNPRHIGEQVKDNIRDATIGRVEHMARDAADRVNEARYTMMDTIRENPVPAAMVGIGLGWLFMNARRQSSSGASFARGYSGAGRYYEERGAGMGYAGSAAGGYDTADYYGSGAYDAGSDRGVTDRAREKVGDAVHGVREGASHVAERASGAAHDVADRARDVASTVADTTRQQARRVEDVLHEQPLAVGAVALALGLAAGLALPATDREVELMGDARDRVVDRVKEVAHEATEKAQTVAERVVTEAKHTAKDAAREEGLTSSPA
jgi:ElaB/YqjD/DUF883 family membrane-anchored ribosome-binding protein